ncbi:MAG: molybdenum cofactor guanylyltransferase [Planctomycetes bacterium]|nr:molybdenum cofactor guanylyltransferase [Planctomycetota bacterium]MCB9824341.1 molybdenum cofactor guanylyltransferase [Planctomycetota bacterium]MCB9828564.1 molybdenum cofactor guanylyltransferase [Planctomycetota bacterium]MCB9900338.1 molybdenum cofactor guanylyltransferase [Planctomycetota bacterium]
MSIDGPRGAVVLAGGRSTRMGRDKATLPWGPAGGTLLGHVVRVLLDVVDDVVVVARSGQPLPELPADVRFAYDDVEDEGPLRGLLAGLRATRASSVYASGCDTPWLRRAFVEALFDAQPDDGIAIAASEGFAHPLAAVYPADAVDDVASLLAAGRRRPIDLLERRTTVRVDEAVLRTVDPELASLDNLNDATAFEAAHTRHVLPDVRIELFERARQLAGRPHGWVSGATARAALAAAVRRWPALAPSVIASDGTPARTYGVSLGGRTFVRDLDAPLADGDALVLVDALSGG